MPDSAFDAVIIGGGFYGCSLALHLRRSGVGRVLILERGDEIMQRASYANQARVHNGYHYPRSLLTGLRSRVNFPRFSREYADCIDDGFEKYYAIGRIFSHVTAAQFRLFCERIGAPVERAPVAVRALFNSHLIEDVFRVRETAFNAVKLRARLQEELRAAGVETRTRCEARRIEQTDTGLALVVETPTGSERIDATRVFNCTYSRINQLLTASGLPTIPLKHELTEMALVEVPDALKTMGITVMCGPFFSVMPFPSLGLHSLSHVRYTPHYSWQDGDGVYRDPYELHARAPRRSNALHMLKDAARYLPVIAGSTHRDSLWEVKTVLPRSEIDDSRPILLKEDYGLPGLTCVMGSKLDNVYDVLDASTPVAGSPTFR
ncbi:MAG: FAD-dependent oxidoreductase [Gemmatimonadota bacterium]